MAPALVTCSSLGPMKTSLLQLPWDPHQKILSQLVNSPIRHCTLIFTKSSMNVTKHKSTNKGLPVQSLKRSQRLPRKEGRREETGLEKEAWTFR